MAELATKTFIAFDDNGAVIYKGRGKVGAAQKAIDALWAHRDAIKAASGMLYGDTSRMGHIKADGAMVDEDYGFDAVDMAR